jgi:hypothetical protein
MKSPRARLIREIYRVKALRSRYDAVRELPHVDVSSVIRMFDDALAKATVAASGADTSAQLVAMRDLQGYTDDDVNRREQTKFTAN